jgi:hypothetical protein
MMKKFYFVFAGFFAFSLQLQAQSGSPTTCSDRITLTSQADVDAFPTTYGCSIVEGPITIIGDDIQNLDGLSGVTQVQFLHISGNPLLTDITGLSHITKAEYLGIVYNDALHDLNGLGALEMTGDLTIRGMTLTDFSDLAALDSLTTLVIEDNNAIGSLHGLENIENLGQLTIARNGQLTNLEGLSGLKRVDGVLSIESNPNLTSVSGAPNLWRVDNLFIGGNELLPDLNGLSSLRSASSIQILYNSALTSLQGLSNLSGGLSLLKLQSDPLLTNLHGLEGITSAGDITIVANSALMDLAGLTLANSGSIEILQNPNMTSLNGLNNLTRIDGGITISMHEKLVDISALSSITQIKGNVRIETNWALKNIDGFSSLTSIAPGIGDPDGALVLRNNVSLINLNGFHKVTNINGDVVIENNGNLENVDSLSAWTVIKAGATLTVANNTDLSRGCGLYNVLHTSNPNTVFYGNGPGISKDQILANGPCKPIAPCTGNITLTSQANVDAFPSTQGCTVIDGKLIISGSDITNLDSLSHLTSTGPLYIEDNPVLNDLSGLRNVTFIKEILSIKRNAVLKNLNGLQSLKTINGYAQSGFNITDNPLLENVDSLSSLVNLTGYTRTFYVTDNPNLTKVCGFYAAISHNYYCPNCSGSFTFTGNGVNATKEDIVNAGACESGTTCHSNATLTTQAEVDGFYTNRSCTVYDGELTITGADINNLDSLYKLTSVRTLYVYSNPQLIDVSGLRNIQNASDGFSINNNNSLVSVSLPALQSTANLYVTENQALAHLDLPAFTSGHNVEIEHNPNLESLAGISSLTDVDILIIDTNDKLTSLHGLESITTVDTWLAIIANNGLTDLTGLAVTNVGALSINNNQNLINLEGLNGLVTAGGGGCQCETSGIFIDRNPKLQNIDALSSVTTISGDLTIQRNTSLRDLDGLSSLTSIGIFPDYDLDRGLTVADNTALQNVDGLSSLTTMPADAKLIVRNNPNLTRGCGFYGVLYNSNPPSTFSGNGAGVTKDEILAAGPCHEAGGVVAATDMTFADVTDNSMTVSFTAGSGQDGYVVIMRAFESSLPDEAPQNGTQYHVGNVIGCCSIVAGTGMETAYNIVYLEPDVDYYFDVIPYTGSYKYSIDKALSGHQRTMPRIQPYPNPFVEEVTIPFTINEESSNVRIMILDQLGRAVSEVVNNQFEKGKHEVRWSRIDLNGNRVGNGVYMYSIVTNESEPVKGLFVAK